VRCKKVSRKFNDFKINLASLPEKIVPSFSTSHVSPSSPGGMSPGKITPIKKQNNLLKDIPVDIRNQLAKACTALKKDPQFIGSGETRRTMMLNTKMIGVLSEKISHLIRKSRKQLQLMPHFALNTQRSIWRLTLQKIRILTYCVRDQKNFLTVGIWINQIKGKNSEIFQMISVNVSINILCQRLSRITTVQV
jgi:hypothetical protein